LGEFAVGIHYLFRPEPSFPENEVAIPEVVASVVGVEQDGVGRECLEAVVHEAHLIRFDGDAETAGKRHDKAIGKDLGEFVFAVLGGPDVVPEAGEDGGEFTLGGVEWPDPDGAAVHFFGADEVKEAGEDEVIDHGRGALLEKGGDFLGIPLLIEDKSVAFLGLFPGFAPLVIGVKIYAGNVLDLFGVFWQLSLPLRLAQ
jgi:hypothetical protein